METIWKYPKDEKAIKDGYSPEIDTIYVSAPTWGTIKEAGNPDLVAIIFGTRVIVRNYVPDNLIIVENKGKIVGIINL